ncbi:sulfotransferase [Rhodopila sp.]|uniref:sulfotransferase n=1 Tax=Rhodopila sp. TaxID=2480087 RepID=UPI003D12B9CA
MPVSNHYEKLAASAILVLGSPRSGTTWLAKIIDSHPDVLYRHEPDELAGPDQRAAPVDQISAWIRQRGLRSAAKRPFFAKSWRPVPLEFTRKSLSLALAAAQRIPMTAAPASRLALPDLVALHRRHKVRAAVKLVNWDGSLAVETMPDCRCCFILRHPCGQVASIMAGWADGRFAASGTGSGEPVDLAEAVSFAATKGVGKREFDALSDAGKLAWGWLAFNEPAVERLQHQPNARIVIYEDLCRQTESLSKDLFAFAGLEWQQQTAAFLAASTRGGQSLGYYDVIRVTAVVADRWRQSMSRPDQDAVRAIVRTSPLTRYWSDLAADVNDPAITQ